MRQLFIRYKSRIAKFLQAYLVSEAGKLQKINPLAADAIRRMLESSLRGKMVRGSLILFATELNGKKIALDTLRAAAALEIFHTGLLAQDDVMDRDRLRRGMKTLYAQYDDWAKARGCKDALHVGESLATCAADAAFFLGFELLSSLKVLPTSLIGTYARELALVAGAQMQDVYFGAVDRVPAVREILEVYRYKTARYTFSLPFRIGGLLAGSNSRTIKQLEELGEHLGLIFQLKDDELGLYGTEKEIGKPVGSDLREGKKTLYYCFLFKRATPQEKKRLQNIFGRPAASGIPLRREKLEIKFVHSLIAKYGISAEIEKFLEKEVKRARGIIGQIRVAAKYKKILNEILEYNLRRTG